MYFVCKGADVDYIVDIVSPQMEQDIEAQPYEIAIEGNEKPIIDEGYGSMPQLQTKSAAELKIDQLTIHDKEDRYASIDDLPIEEQLIDAQTNTKWPTVPVKDYDTHTLESKSSQEEFIIVPESSKTHLNKKEEPKSKIPKLKVNKSWFTTGDVINSLKKIGKNIKDTEKKKKNKSPVFIRRNAVHHRQDTVKEETERAPPKPRVFEECYKVIRQIGTGGHSTVKLGIKIGSSETVVCKFIHSSNVWHWAENNLPMEIHMMRMFTADGNQSFIKYIEHFEVGDQYIIIMEHLGKEWIDLYDYIEIYGPVKEDHSRDIFGQVVSAIEYMHSLGYSHNDIKGICI